MLAEFYAATAPVPTLRGDARALQELPGMIVGDEWVMVTLRDGDESGVVELAELFVPEDYRGRRYASAALKWVTALARKHQCKISSYIQPFDAQPRLSKRALRAWYRRHGFRVRRDDTMEYRPK